MSAQSAPRAQSSLLALHDLHQAYDGREVVRGLSFRLERGAIGCLLGPSGCGKTTVLRCIAGFEPVTRGEILLGGRLVSGPGVMVPPEARRIDAHAPSKDSVEGATRRRAFEAGEAPAGVDAPSRRLRARRQPAVVGYEAHQLGLRGLPSAA